MKGGLSQSPYNDVDGLLFVVVHLDAVLAPLNPQNFQAAEKMDSADNINA